jgi:pimeloyl-ACP methyl ester carboxylesterase
MAHSIAFRKIVPQLASRYRLIIPDLPAHGRDHTFRARGLEPNIGDMVDWLSALLDAVEGGENRGRKSRVHLLGHSMSALVAFVWAQKPGAMERVKTLSLVSPGVRIGLPKWTHHAVKMMPFKLAQMGATPLGMRCYEPIQWRKSRMTSSEVASYVEPFRESDRLRFMVDLGADLVRKPDRLAGAEQVRHRTLILWGDRDHLIRRKTVRALKSGISDAQVEVLRGVGHCPMEDSPDDFSRILSRFLAR